MAIMQERDLRIVNFLKEQGWALSTHLADLYFQSNPSLCQRRMKLLEKDEVVESKNFYDFYGRGNFIDPTLRRYLQVDPRTKLYRLGKAFEGRLGNRWKRLAHESMVMHQALLAHVRWAFNTQLGDLPYISEAMESFLIHIDENRRGQGDVFPDLAFQLGELKICIELERKGRRGLGNFNGSYEDRIDKLSAFYDRVIYVMVDENDLTKLIRLGGGIRNVGFMSFFNLNQVLRENYEPISLNQFLSQEYSHESQN